MRYQGRARDRFIFNATITQRQIAATDKQIDQLVYAPCDLTEEEIALVEGAA